MATENSHKFPITKFKRKTKTVFGMEIDFCPKSVLAEANDQL